MGTLERQLALEAIAALLEDVWMHHRLTDEAVWLREAVPVPDLELEIASRP